MGSALAGPTSPTRTLDIVYRSLRLGGLYWRTAVVRKNSIERRSALFIGYRLSSGREFFANGGLVSIARNADGTFRIREGYDGMLLGATGDEPVPTPGALPTLPAGARRHVRRIGQRIESLPATLDRNRHIISAKPRHHPFRRLRRDS